MNPFWLVPWTAAIIATRAVARRMAPKPPAAGTRSPAAAATPRVAPPQPGPTAVPAPPGAHPGTLVRLAAIYACDAGGHCQWVWRGQGLGWQHVKPCVTLPTPDQYDWWAQTLTGGDT